MPGIWELNIYLWQQSFQYLWSTQLFSSVKLTTWFHEFSKYFKVANRSTCYILSKKSEIPKKISFLQGNIKLGAKRCKHWPKFVKLFKAHFIQKNLRFSKYFIKYNYFIQINTLVIQITLLFIQIKL